MRVVAKLWVKDSKFDEFRRFETAAFAIMAKHGGRVVDIVQNHATNGDDPHEIHVLEFPNPDAFDAYRSDSELASLAVLRDACIEKTKIEAS